MREAANIDYHVSERQGWGFPFDCLLSCRFFRNLGPWERLREVALALVNLETTYHCIKPLSRISDDQHLLRGTTYGCTLSHDLATPVERRAGQHASAFQITCSESLWARKNLTMMQKQKTRRREVVTETGPGAELWQERGTRGCQRAWCRGSVPAAKRYILYLRYCRPSANRVVRIAAPTY